jgi:glycosyltransferase involved in cell wall biosynthesis
MTKLLFILKKRETYWGDESGYTRALSSGLSNSVRFVVDMLNRHGVVAVAEQADDNNCIDRLVTKHRPTHVIIEAYWVVPEKFDVLKPLHPTVRWIVRNHSEVPFLANEGSAFGWTVEYLRRGIQVMCNSKRAQSAMRAVAHAHGMPEGLVTYGPNVYPAQAVEAVRPHLHPAGPKIDICCFGAIRPLKNHMSQAIAAIQFADAIGKRLRFHVNGTRVEGGGNPILKNLRNLFDGSLHELVEHDWLDHEQFVALIGTMRIAMQVSYTETFNIVSADAMSRSVPVVVSDVPWLGDYAEAEPNKIGAMVRLLLEIWRESPERGLFRLHQQRRDLLAYVRDSEAVWVEAFPAMHSLLAA